MTSELPLTAGDMLPTAELRLPELPENITGVEIRRSTRRKKTVSARLSCGVVVVLMPAGLTANEEQKWIDRMVGQVAKRTRPNQNSDGDLVSRAQEIARRYLDQPAGSKLAPSSVRWVSNMEHRWGSCSPDTGAIRLSDRLIDMPVWVVDYVLAHELSHLKYSGHSKQFWQLVNHYPSAQRASGYLEGWAAAHAQTSECREK